MRVLKKMSFDALVGNISIEDMRFIIAGSGSVVNGSSYTQQTVGAGTGSGNMGYYATDRGVSSPFSPSGTLLYSPNGNYSDPAISSNQNTYGYGTANYGGSYGSGSYGSSNGNAQGWASTGNGIVTTNASDISRFLNFVITSNATNSNLSWNSIADFLNREQTVEGRAFNNATYGAIMLDNVNVINNYKAPSSLPTGINYQNGVLSLGILMGSGGYMTLNAGMMMGSGSAMLDTFQSRTSAVLTAFTKEQVVASFNKIDFAGMALESIPDWDPIKKEHNYMNSFQPTMKINVDGAVAIALYEQLSLSIYDNDGSANGTATIGFGHKLHSGLITSSDTKNITFDQAISYFASDIIVTENMLNRKIENLDLGNSISRNQYFALFDMFYNAGNGKENDSIGNQVLQALKNGGNQAANKVIEDAYRNADPSKGIMDRRYFEAQAFIYGRSLTPEESRDELVKLGLKK